MGRPKISDREVVESGAVFMQPGDEILELSYENLVYRLIFDDHIAEAGQQPTIDAEIVEGRLEIRLHNFNAALGSSWWGDVGKIGQQKLYLGFAVHTIGPVDNMSRTISYTFTLGVAGG